MDQARPIPVSFKKWVVISAFIGYIALVIYLFFFVGFFDLVATLGKVNLGVYALAIGSVIASIFFHALVWFQLLNYLNIKLGFRRTFTLYWVGIFVDNLIPGGWSGDLFKAYLLGREPNIEGGTAVASVVAKNMYEAIFNLGNMVLGLILLLLNYTFEGSILIGVGGIMFLLTLPLVILIIISFKPKGAKRAVHGFMQFLSKISRNKWRLRRFERQIDHLLDDYHEGMNILIKKPKVFLQPLLFSFIAWGFEVFTLFLVFAALGSLVSPDKVIIVRSIAGNIEAQGYAFAGYAQIVTTSLYSILGIIPALAASVALLGGVVFFWLRTIVSYVAFHCVVFSNCASLVCKEVRADPNDNCKTNQNTNG